METKTPGGPLSGLLPAIRRARDFRLYTGQGRRLVDLWQLGGAALLGHTPAGVLRDFKNTAERGLFAPFPHPLAGRFTKALARLFPQGDFRVYADEISLCRALEQAGWGAGFLDPAFAPNPAAAGPMAAGPMAAGPMAAGPMAAGPMAAGPAAGPLAFWLWRPFLKSPALSPEAPVQRPVLPLPWPGAPQVLILEASQSPRFPPPDPVSPAILAAAVRAIYDLIADPARGRPRFPKIEKALSRSQWRGQGIYLTLPNPPDEAAYADLFRDFLNRGFLLPPAPNQPLILPGVLSPGEEAALAALL